MPNQLDPKDKPPLAVVLAMMVAMFHMGNRTTSQIQASVGPFRSKTTGQEEFFSTAFIEKVTGSTRPRNEEQADKERMRKLSLFAKIVDRTQHRCDALQIQDYLCSEGFWAELDLIDDIILYYSKWVDSSYR